MAVDLQDFGDASISSYCTVAYAVVYQPSKSNQVLVVSKSRLSKNDQTIPRAELIATHMATNLATNIAKALKDYNIEISNRVDRQYSCLTLVERSRKLQSLYRKPSQKNNSSHEFIKWNYVPAKQNPEDTGSRGGSVGKITYL